MKDGIRNILGKTVKEVVYSDDARNSDHVFLVFTDGTYFELWGDSITCAGGLDHGDIDSAVRYAKSSGAERIRCWS